MFKTPTQALGYADHSRVVNILGLEAIWSLLQLLNSALGVEKQPQTIENLMSVS